MIPISLKIDEGRPCLVVGGGQVALRKVRWLMACGAQVVAVSREFDPGFDEVVRRHPARVTMHREDYEAIDPALELSRFQLVIAATDDAGINSAVAEEARRVGVPVNVVDRPELCSFYVPAVVQRGDLQIAVTTSGAAPSLAARIRRELEEQYPDGYGTFAAAIGIVRRELSHRGLAAALRGELLAYLSPREVADSLAGQSLEACAGRLRQLAEAWIAPGEDRPDEER